MDLTIENFHPLSWADPSGRLFWLDGHLYRGIRDSRAAFYRNLMDQGIIQELVDRRLLVETSLSDMTTEEFPLILEHRVIPTVSFASEWSASQLKAAALLVLDLEITLRAKNLTLVDVNPWNLLFDSSHPYLVDFCCITALAERYEWTARDQFCQFFLNPLLIFEKGLPRVARRLLFDPSNGISPQELHGICGIKHKRGLARVARDGAKAVAHATVPKRFHAYIKAEIRPLVSRMSRSLRQHQNAMTEILMLRERIAALNVLGPKTSWGGFYIENFPPFTSSNRWTEKHHSIHSIIVQTRPKTLLDIGSNRGWYAQLAAHHGARVIASDSDETAINELYLDARQKQLPILAVHMDFRFPEPAQGPSYKLLPPATQRFKSEMVLALALVHHLVFTFRLSFEQIVENLLLFCDRWLVVEFVGPKDNIVIKMDPHNEYRSWYTIDCFVKCLGRGFRVLDLLPSDNGGLDSGVHDRTIIFCEKTSRSP